MKTLVVGYGIMSLVMLAIVSRVNGQNIFSTISGPDKKVMVKVEIKAEGLVFYHVFYNNQSLLKLSKLGMVLNDGDFSKGLNLLSSSNEERVKDDYEMVNAKRKHCHYEANRKVLHFQNAGKQFMDIIFQVSNDGVAFRYFFPGASQGARTVVEEKTSFHLPSTARAWLQPMQVAKSGWESTNPAYEEHYSQNISSDSSSPTKAGWVYPALFNAGDAWIVITESSLDSNYCGTHLKSYSPDAEYSIAFADPKEINPGGGYLPKSTVPFYSPWRIIAIGSLATIEESTLGTDLAKPAININTDFVKPGKASWSWIISKDDSIVYSEQKRYIDYASDMHWQYCLIDVNWDQKIGYEKMEELSKYAATKNVGLLLWYNSSGSWNTTKYTPKGALLTAADRQKEFARLKAMGIKGVKIDFFGGDGQSVVKYYIDILNDAARMGLLVNFHGATLPRGWQRTYPNLLTTEAVRGFEMVTFSQNDANAEAEHCATLAFARNVFDPMDFTPMNLYKIATSVKRKTTSAFELALSVVFLSGIQHYAESPAGMNTVPAEVKDFLRHLPNNWDDVKFIDGYPGKYIVIARRSDDKWYVAGINAETNEKTISLDLSTFKKKKGKLIRDGEAELSFVSEEWKMKNVRSKKITMKPSGGFVLVLE